MTIAAGGMGALIERMGERNALSSLSDAFSNLSLPVAQGLVAVPAVAVGVLAWYLMSRK